MGSSPSADDPHYRLNVGICLVNRQGKVWMGKAETAGPETVTPGREWQMPQGGIDDGESVIRAATRELFEETGIHSACLLGVTSNWWSYDFPPGYQPIGHKLDPFTGQTQKWAAFLFTGEDSDFDITARETGEPREFFDWRWMGSREALERAVVFKQQQYERVFGAFRDHLSD